MTPALVELVRLPAALSVPGDVLVGAVAAGRPPRPAVVGASVCLYWAGMALNDWADRSVDARERPGRPIPSGRVAPTAALAVAGGLTLGGLALAGFSPVALALAGTVWAYDLGGRGPVLMSLARGLDVLLGAGGAGGAVAALPAAATVAAHTAVVMGLSAVETTGGPAAARRARWALGGTGLVTAAARPGSWVAGGLAAAYAGVVGRAQLAAARDPRPATVQRAVGAGVLGVVPLQAALLARSGAPGLAVGVAGLWPLARRLSRRVSPT